MKRLHFFAALLVACAAPPPAQSPTKVRYHEDVAPILQTHCSACHREGGIGPGTFATYDDAVAWADAIVLQTGTRAMPPWGVTNSGECNTWRDARWLSDAEIQTLATWVSDGKERGDPAHLLQEQQPLALDTDVLLDPGTAYTPDAQLTDDYRCFIVDPGLTSDRFITGYEVLPGEPRVVHHVIVYSMDSAASESQAAELDLMHEGLGYQCFGTSNLPDSRPLIGWAPGTPATTFPDDTGIKTRAGRKLVVQLHYNTRAGLLPDHTRVRLQTREAVANEAFIYGVATPGLLVQPDQELALVTQEYSLSALGVPVGIFVRGVFPHMHTLGRTLRVEVVHDGEPACMADVPAWSFDWQQFYFYDRPVYVFPNDTIRITCGFDTTSRTQPVRWGEGTQDEMCLAGLYVTLF